jgi:succinyl-diaminopimelate desuccinylase
MAVPSPSKGEAALAGLVEDALRACPSLDVERIGDNVVGRTTLGHGRRLVLAGHLDTVPPIGNEAPTLEGDAVWGVGASDMKGGLAVMLDLAATVREPAVDVTWCFYAREEIGRADSGLLELWRERPDLLAGDAAVLGEPTSALVEAGCQGTMRVRITLRGVRAHTARPFTGRNAIPGGGRRRGSGGQRRPRRGPGHPEPPLRAGPASGGGRSVPARPPPGDLGTRDGGHLGAPRRR